MKKKMENDFLRTSSRISSELYRVHIVPERLAVYKARSEMFCCTSQKKPTAVDSRRVFSRRGFPLKGYN